MQKSKLMPKLNNWHVVAHQLPNEILLQRSLSNCVKYYSNNMIARMDVNANQMSYLDVAAKANYTFRIFCYLDIIEDVLRFPE